MLGVVVANYGDTNGGRREELTIIYARKHCGERWRHWSHDWYGNATTYRYFCDGWPS